MLKLNQRAGAYVNSGKTNYYHPVKEIAMSYDWWVYMKRINGVLVFNGSFYSNTTSKHQSETLNLIMKNHFKEKPLVINGTRASLDDLEEVVKDLNAKREKLLSEINNPRSRPAKNAERVQELTAVDEWIVLLTTAPKQAEVLERRI